MKQLPVHALSLTIERCPLDDATPLPMPGDIKLRELGTVISRTIRTLRCLCLSAASNATTLILYHSLWKDQSWQIIMRDERNDVVKLYPLVPSPCTQMAQDDFASLLLS